MSPNPCLVASDTISIPTFPVKAVDIPLAYCLDIHINYHNR